MFSQIDEKTKKQNKKLQPHKEVDGEGMNSCDTMIQGSRQNKKFFTLVTIKHI
jgi:hypothetical protein